MPKKHPPEWGWKAVKYRYIEKLESPSDIVARFKEKHRDVGKSWVKQRIANYEQTGHPNPPPERNASRKRATPRERKWLKKQLCLNPVQFFDQLQVTFKRRFGYKISRKMLAQALKHAGAPGDMDDLPLSMKKVERIARQRSSQKRARFRQAMRGISARQAVWLDESSMADRASVSRLGWAPVGQPAKLAEIFKSSGRLWSLLAAVNLEGFILPACKMIEGGVDDEKFISWAETHLLPQLNPYDYRRLRNSVVVLDNAVIHTQSGFAEMLEEKGCLVLWLSPYSPVGGACVPCSSCTAQDVSRV